MAWKIASISGRTASTTSDLHSDKTLRSCSDRISTSSSSSADASSWSALLGSVFSVFDRSGLVSLINDGKSTSKSDNLGPWPEDIRDIRVRRLVRLRNGRALMEPSSIPSQHLTVLLLTSSPCSTCLPARSSPPPLSSCTRRGPIASPGQF
eukprot:766557-Hanusia_phi.AAC.5